MVKHLKSKTFVTYVTKITFEFFQVATKLMMHEHAQTWSVLKTLYSSPGESGSSTVSTLAPSTKTALAAGSHGSGGGLSTTGNPEPTAGK